MLAVDLLDGDLDFAETVDSAGHYVAAHDRADALWCAGHDEIAGSQRHRLRNAGDDFRDTPDQFRDVGILFHGTVHRQPKPALGHMADLADRMQRRDRRGQIETLPPIPGPPLLSRGELKIAAGQVDADGITVDVVKRALDWN